MNKQEIVVEFAERFGSEWLPKFKSVSRSIRETQASLEAEGRERATLPNSFTLQCAQKQYVKVSQFCGELWNALTDWRSAMVPLYPDADSAAAYPPLLPLAQQNKFEVCQRQ